MLEITEQYIPLTKYKGIVYKKKVLSRFLSKINTSGDRSEH